MLLWLIVTNSPAKTDLLCSRKDHEVHCSKYATLNSTEFCTSRPSRWKFENIFDSHVVRLVSFLVNKSHEKKGFDDQVIRVLQ